MACYGATFTLPLLLSILSLSRHLRLGLTHTCHILCPAQAVILKNMCINRGSRDCVIGSDVLRAGRPRKHDSIPSFVARFFQQHPHRLWGPLNLLFIGYVVLFSGGGGEIKQRGVKATTLLHLVLRVRIRGAIPP
jgi:hypothetical protein